MKLHPVLLGIALCLARGLNVPVCLDIRVENVLKKLDHALRSLAIIEAHVPNVMAASCVNATHLGRGKGIYNYLIANIKTRTLVGTTN